MRDLVGLIPGRQARLASTAWNVAKTLAQIATMWSVFFVAGPLLALRAEDLLGLGGWRLVQAGFRACGLTLFAVCGALGIANGVFLSVQGRGTPLPADAPRELVIAGPYRHVRNPMAMVSLAQGAAVGLYLGSPFVLAYVLIGGLIWNYAARPWEEQDLALRFGDAFLRYRSHVRCWWPRLRPYDPDREK